MGVSRWLARTAAQAPHLLVVEAPNGWLVRVAVEGEIAHRGWRQALSPADADLLVVCGTSASPELTSAIDHVWDQLPGPRVRIELTYPGSAVGAALDDALTDLIDHAWQGADATARDVSCPDTSGSMEVSQDSHDDHDTHSGHDEAGSGGERSGHGGHGDMDHGHMDMAGPGGLALASGGPDRDGLEMDVLHLPLGPVLVHWPAGLVVTLTLQGDVITEAELQQTPDDDPRSWGSDGRHRAVRRCDAAVGVLSLAGAERAATRARATRDLLLDPAVPDETAATAVDITRQKLRRSWLLRWSLRGLAPLPHAGPLAGDVYDRLLRLLDVAADEVRVAATVDAPSPDFAMVLPELLLGAELATARLAIASVAGFCDLAARPSQEVAHG